MEQGKEGTGGGWLSAIPNILKQAAANPFTIPFLIVTVIGLGALWWSVESNNKTVEVLQNQIENCVRDGDEKQKIIDDNAKENKELVKQLLQHGGYTNDTIKQ